MGVAAVQLVERSRLARGEAAAEVLVRETPEQKRAHFASTVVCRSWIALDVNACIGADAVVIVITVVVAIVVALVVIRLLGVPIAGNLSQDERTVRLLRKRDQDFVSGGERSNR